MDLHKTLPLSFSLSLSLKIERHMISTFPDDESKSKTMVAKTIKSNPTVALN